MTVHRAPSALTVFFLSFCAAQAKVDFVKDVQPVFEKSCQGCHGAKSQLGNLRLDSRQLAMKAIKPGDSAASSLYKRVAGIGTEARMPMGAKPLTPDEIATIKTWIDEGAEWPESASVRGAEIKKHWAYVAPVRPEAPKTGGNWVRNPVDAFVLARLQKESLHPAEQADRVTLLRRLSLDITGLPPTIAEVDAFLADQSPRAYEKQVDRLLESPHYGERWSRHWLDSARYADSDGFEKDKMRNVWFYRDWVINAFNRDLPYNQFLTEQLAGDLLPNSTQDQKVATGFLRNSMINEEGGIDPEQFRMEAMFDRMDAIGKSMLGLTIQCAQCHTHKYDPLTHDEYYRLFAFLNNSHEANMPTYTPEEQKKRAEIFAKMREIETGLQHRTTDWLARMTAWEQTVRHDQPEWTVITPEVDDISTGGQKYIPQKDGSFLAYGYAPTKHKVKFLYTAKAAITGFRVELLNDPNLPLGGPGRSIKGTGALTEFEVEVDGKKVKFGKATADVNPPEHELDKMFFDKTDKRRVTGPVEYAIDGKEETAWGHDVGPVRRNLPRKAVFVPEKPLEPGAIAVFLNQRHGGWNSDDNMNHNLGRFRLSVTSAPDPVADPLPVAVRDIVTRVPVAERTQAQQQAVFRHWLTTVPEWSASARELEDLWKQMPEGATQLVLSERNDMRETHVLTRGDFLKPGKSVEPGVPAYLNPLPAGAPANRLGFAQWLTSREAPTTARSMVNRIWQSYFGTGLVSTSEDLGRQADPPSHPELLDWLAVDFMDNKWSLKALHRTIVTSATYRQSSKVTPELLQKDPANRLLARGPRLRVEAELVRDIALAASGLLNGKVGGPSVFPPAPDFLFQPPVSYGPKNWYEDKDADRYRRALYTFRYRSVPYPMLQTFDAPNGDFACVRRPRSNTPLQALTTLNEPLFLETARALALKALTEGGATDADRLTYAFRRVLARRPLPAESDELLSLLARQTGRFDGAGANPMELIAADPAKPPALPSGATPAQAAAWTAVSRVLLNLDETITKE